MFQKLIWIYKFRNFYPLSSLSRRTYFFLTIIVIIIVIASICASGILLSIIFPIFVKFEPRHYIWTFGILFATLGWIITVKNNIRLSRRQHTMNVLVQHSFSNESRKHISVLLAVFPGSKNLLTKKDVQSLFDASEEDGMGNYYIGSKDTPTLKAVYTSVLEQLNYYEFLAVGIKSGDLDVIVMKDFYRGILCNYCDKTYRFIKQWNEENPKVFENLIELYKAWKPSKTFPVLGTDQTTDSVSA